ncbi:MAG: PD-(D/E)XK nuclease family protein, partial [Victivallales bacterium]|nr:PD-(D/E)XK nuclease family protein [Victivallales bacterium]
LAMLERTWQSRTFLTMFQEFLRFTPAAWCGATDAPAVARIIYQSPDGRRSLANLRQLAEILHAKAQERRLGQDGLLRLFASQVKVARQKAQHSFGSKDESSDGNEFDAEEMTLRRPSDEPAVRMMTIFKSKGLQFGLVYVYDFLFASFKPSSIFHLDGRRSFDLNKEGKGDEERNQEELRKLYVAITRAIALCRFIDGPPPKSGTPMSVATLLESNGGLNEIKEEESLPLGAPGEVVNGNEGQGTSERKAEVFPAERQLSPGWLTCSFSSLTRSVHSAGSVPDAKRLGMESDEDDESDDKEDDEENGGSTSWQRVEWPLREPIFQFSSGEVAGIYWHELFEKLDFQMDGEWRAGTPCEQLSTAPHSALWMYVSDFLQRRRQLPKCDEQEGRHLSAFVDIVRGILHTTLPGTGFALADISKERRLPELRFTYRLRNGFRSADLLVLLERAGIRAPSDWQQNRNDHHALTGSIDLLFQGTDGKFYIIDWKTNILNASYDGFDHAGMQREMDDHFYTLQYLLYALAWVQFMRYSDPSFDLRRDYEIRFGGVCYVFCRGVSTRTGAERGFFATRPSLELLSGLDCLLGIDLTQEVEK